jgi:Transposase IS66 family
LPDGSPVRRESHAGFYERPEVKILRPTHQAGTNVRPTDKPAGQRPRDKMRPRVSVEDTIVKAEVPPGSRFKGHEDFVVQDLVLRVRVIRYRRERWVTPDGRTVIAPLPSGVSGHFGPELRRFVLMQYHQGQVTVPRLMAILQAMGVGISKRQVMRLLIADQDAFLAEARDVLRTGLETASWITVDDTGARHKGSNGVCTHIGNDHFAWFKTTGSKSRLNFLDLLRAGYTDYVVNAAALAYMREHSLAGPTIARLAEHPDKQFADPAAWQAHLERLGITALTVTPDPVQIATEGALWGASMRMSFYVTRWLSAMTLASSRSVNTRCAGCMPSGWCTSSTRSPSTSASRRSMFAR